MGDHIKVCGEIPKTVPDGAILDIHTKGINSHTHGFHKYPGKFIPNIPRWAIRKYAPEGTWVVDPFCGSGTSLVEAMLSGRNALGIDIDPLSVFISRVKTRRVNIDLLKQTAIWLEQKMDSARGGSFRPECETIEHWFSKKAITALGRIREAIDALPAQFKNAEGIKNIQDIWYVCFSSILRRVSNADNESQKTFVSSTNPKKPEDAAFLFRKRMSFFIERMEVFAGDAAGDAACKVVCADSSKKISTLKKQHPAMLIVTSPPYIKAIDYIYNQMAELFWVGDMFGLQTQKKQNILKPFYVGTKSVPARVYSKFSPSAAVIPEVQETLREICARDIKNGKYHACITNAYFISMSRHLADAAELLPEGGRYVMVVGNCFVSGVAVDVAGAMSRIAENAGFSVEKKWGYIIKNRYMRFNRNGRGGLITHDWVLEMKRV